MCLRWCLLSWHRSRLGFVTPCIGEVSLGSGAEVKMDLQEAVFDKEVFREELRTQKQKVAKLEEQNLEIPENSSGTEGR